MCSPASEAGAFTRLGHPGFAAKGFYSLATIATVTWQMYSPVVKASVLEVGSATSLSYSISFDLKKLYQKNPKDFRKY